MSSSEGEEEVQFTFTEQQLAILHEEKDSYRDTNKKLRQKKVNEIFKRMKTSEKEDKDFNSKKDVVQGAILAWLQRYARRKTEEKGFLEPWTLRRVVGIKHEQDVLLLRDRKFAEAQRTESDRKTGDEDGSEGDDEDDTAGNNKKGKGNGQKDKAFNYYQAALTEVVENLTEEEMDEMQQLAQTWNENGPPLDTQRKLAVKCTMNKTKLFAHQMFRQYRVRYFFYIAYEDEAGTILTTAMDYNALVATTIYD